MKNGVACDEEKSVILTEREPGLPFSGGCPRETGRTG
jgi:hypothetical protein